VHRWDLRDFVAELPPWPELGVALCCCLLLDLLADSQRSEPLSSGMPDRTIIKGNEPQFSAIPPSVQFSDTHQ